MTDRKYLVPFAVGVCVLALILMGVVLFSSGNTELGASAGAGAVALAEVERRRQSRARAQAELDEQARQAVGSNQHLGGTKAALEETMARNVAKVTDTPLADLVDEENRRRG